jgi:hypothetical protein
MDPTMTWIDEKTTKPRFEISDEMVALYAQMRRLRCTCPPWPEGAA